MGAGLTQGTTPRTDMLILVFLFGIAFFIWANDCPQPGGNPFPSNKWEDFTTTQEDFERIQKHLNTPDAQPRDPPEGCQIFGDSLKP